MDSTGFNRSLLPPLAGIRPLNDLLPDLPLPSHLPTKLEKAIYSGTPLHDTGEINKFLNHEHDPLVLQQIASALSEVDTGFLKFKKQRETTQLNNHPTLVRKLLDISPSIFDRCSVNVNKMDISGLPLPSASSAPPAKAAIEQNTAHNKPTPQAPGSPHTYSQIRAEKAKKILNNTHTEIVKSEMVPPQEARLNHEQPDVQHMISSSTDNRKCTMHKKRKRSSTDEPSLVISIKRSKLAPVQIEPGRLKLKKKKKKPHSPKSYKISISREHLNQNKNLSSSMPHLTSKVLQDSIVPANYGMQDTITVNNMVDEPVKKVKKHKEKRHKKLLLPVQDVALSNALQRFNYILETIFQHSEKWETPDVKETDEDISISPELLLPYQVVSDIAAQTCMLRHQAVVHQVQLSNLVQLIGIMDKHVIDSKHLLLHSFHCDEDPRIWKEIGKERIMRSCEASLVILFIATSPQVPKQVQMEETFESIVNMTKFQLENNVFPEFDPVYKVDPSGKESGLLPKVKRKSGTNTTGRKEILPIYNKLIEVFECLAELVEKQTLTDTTVLRVSSLGITPFFVENVSALQLSALRLVTAVFSKYDRHRILILEDIMHSLTRLPTTKRSLRNYKITNEHSIQMMTALVLQLIHSVISCKPKEELSKKQGADEDETPNSADSIKESSAQESLIEEVMLNSYEMACKTAQNFLSEFLKKCGSSKEEDFKSIFDNFVQDLLITLNHPEWPAAELVLTQLGLLLVHTFGLRSNELGLRVLSLDHLGTIAARLRRDAVTSTKQDNEEIIDILSKVLQCRVESKTPSPTEIGQLDAFSENAQHLQKALIYHLTRKSAVNSACTFARNFHLAQWLKDVQLEVEKSIKNSSEKHADASEIFHIAQQKREFLASLRKPKKTFKMLEEVIDDAGAVIVTRYLSSFRSLSKSFDFYLLQLLKVLNEPAVHVRTKAMKALSVIVAADPSILSRNDMQVSVRKRLGDQSTLVREATVDLLGRFILTQPEISQQYYDMLSERILDSGVSVRKRVIKILRDICIHISNFPKLTDCHIKLLRRINDEEGIKSLVTGAFHQLWFTSTGSTTREEIMKKVKSIIAVVGSCKDTEWFEMLLKQLLKSEDSAVVNAILNAFQQIIDCLMKVVLALDEQGTVDGEKFHLASCMSTLALFCKVKPNLMLKHATTLQPYLSTQCNNQGDVMVIHYVASILELVVPLLDHPSETFLASLEEDIIKLTMKQGQMVVQSCLSCLSAIVNRVTKNFKLVKDSFHKFYDMLESVKAIHVKDNTNPKLVSLRPSILRSLFTVGLFCKHFNIDVIVQTSSKAPSLVKSKVLPLLMYFSSYDHAETQIKAVIGLGFLCIRYPELMMEDHIKRLYQSWLSSPIVVKKCQILKNLLAHFTAEENRLQTADHEWYAEAKDLVSIGDKNASVSSAAAQTFLQDIFSSFFTTHLQVRLTSLTVLNLILRQGLVHPAQCIPYLITMSTDSESSVRLKAEQLMNEIDSKYGTFMQTQLQGGVKKSYEFQKLVSSDIVRGCELSTTPHSKLAHVYTLIRSHKQQRRAFLKSLLRHFEDIKSPLGWLLYLADTLAFLPYSTLEEPLFVVHHIEMTISVTGSSLLQQFKEVLGLNAVHDEDNETMDTLCQRVTGDLSALNECCSSSQGCMLLLVLKQHLKQLYGLSDNKCQQYSPTEATKAYDKAPTRKQGVLFNPEFIVTLLKSESHETKINRSKTECLDIYFQFKNLLNSLDPFEHDEDDSDDKDNLPPAQAQDHPTDVKGDTAITTSDTATAPITRKGSRSRASSSSSAGSNGNKKHSKKGDKKSKKKKMLVSTDSSEDEYDPEIKIH